MKSILRSAGLGFLVTTMGCDGESPQEPAPPTASTPAGSLQLVYSNNLDGEIEPCG